MNRPALSIVQQGGASDESALSEQSKNAEHEASLSSRSSTGVVALLGAAPVGSSLLSVWLNDPEWIRQVLLSLRPGLQSATDPGSFNETARKGSRPQATNEGFQWSDGLWLSGDPTTAGAVSPISNRPPHTPGWDACDGQSGGQSSE